MRWLNIKEIKNIYIVVLRKDRFIAIPKDHIFKGERIRYQSDLIKCSKWVEKYNKPDEKSNLIKIEPFILIKKNENYLKQLSLININKLMKEQFGQYCPTKEQK